MLTYVESFNFKTFLKSSHTCLTNFLKANSLANEFVNVLRVADLFTSNFVQWSEKRIKRFLISVDLVNLQKQLTAVFQSSPCSFLGSLLHLALQDSVAFVCLS